jgi:hypothetical protein
LPEIEDSAQTAFWSPDSRMLAFFEGNKLKKMDLAGGPPATITDTTGTPRASGSWNEDDVIIFSSAAAPLFRVPAAGGSATPLTQLDATREETEHSAPWFLSDGRHYLFIAQSADPKKGGVYVGDLASKTRRRVDIGTARVIYVNPGYLLYARGQVLVAQPFDTTKLETTGDAVRVADNVSSYTNRGAEVGYFFASQNGVLTYTSNTARANVQLTWLTARGENSTPWERPAISNGSLSRQTAPRSRWLAATRKPTAASISGRGIWHAAPNRALHSPGIIGIRSGRRTVRTFSS